MKVVVTTHKSLKVKPGQEVINPRTVGSVINPRTVINPGTVINPRTVGL